MLTEYQRGSIFGAVIVAAAFSFSLSVQQHSVNEHSNEKSSNIRTSHNEQKSFWDATASDPINVFTLGLVIVAGVQAYLFVWQLGYMRQGLGDAKKAADAAHNTAMAAKRSADAAIAIELPIIRAAPGKPMYGTAQDQSGTRYTLSVDELSFSNVGCTNCFPIEVQFGLTIGDQLPASPVYQFAKEFPINHILLPDNIMSISLVEFEFERPIELYDKLRADQVQVWFYCNCIYMDFMHARHEAGFCWRRRETFGAGVFREDPTPAYNQKT